MDTWWTLWRWSRIDFSPDNPQTWLCICCCIDIWAPATTVLILYHNGKLCIDKRSALSSECLLWTSLIPLVIKTSNNTTCLRRISNNVINITQQFPTFLVYEELKSTQFWEFLIWKGKGAKRSWNVRLVYIRTISTSQINRLLSGVLCSAAAFTLTTMVSMTLINMKTHVNNCARKLLWLTRYISL